MKSHFGQGSNSGVLVPAELRLYTGKPVSLSEMLVLFPTSDVQLEFRFLRHTVMCQHMGEIVPVVLPSQLPRQPTCLSKRY